MEFREEQNGPGEHREKEACFRTAIHRDCLRMQTTNDSMAMVGDWARRCCRAPQKRSQAVPRKTEVQQRTERKTSQTFVRVSLGEPDVFKGKLFDSSSKSFRPRISFQQARASDIHAFNPHTHGDLSSIRLFRP